MATIASGSVLQPMMSEMELSNEEIILRKAWLEFTEEDVANLVSLNKVAKGYAEDVIEDLYRHFLAFDETRSFFRANRAKVVVMDITGVPSVDSKVANHLVQTVDAARLMGAAVIVTGLSSEVAQALVIIGVDLNRLKTVVDLQGGIEEAERILGYRVTRTDQS